MRTLSLALISLFVSAAASAGELILPTTAGELQLTEDGQEFVATYSHIEKDNQNWFGSVSLRVPTSTGGALQRVATEFEVGWHPGEDAGPRNNRNASETDKKTTPGQLPEQVAGAGANMEALEPGTGYFTMTGAAELQRGEALPDAAALLSEARNALAWTAEASSFIVITRGLAGGFSAGASMGDTLTVDETEICSADGTTCTTQAVFGPGTSAPFSAKAGLALQYTGLKKKKETSGEETSATETYNPGFLLNADLADLGGAAAFEGSAELFWAPIVDAGKQAPRTGFGVDVNAPLTGGPGDVIPRVCVGATL